MYQTARKCFFILWLLTPLLAFSQGKVMLQLHVTDGDRELPQGKYKMKEQFESDLELDRAIRALVIRLHSNGFVEASVDSQLVEENTRQVFLHVGNRYVWGQLSKGNVPDVLLQQVGYKERFFSGSNFNFKTVEQLLNKIITYQENNGYPFAQVNLDSIEIQDDSIYAQLHLEQNQLFTYDTIGLHGEARISKKFLYSYLGIKPNGLYNESVVLKAGKRIRELPFLQEERPLQVFFLTDKAQLHFFLKERKTSRFDFLLGVLPNNDVTGRVLITGEILLDLVSPFGRGEKFFLNWKRLQARTQSLETALRYPYILSAPLGVEFEFMLYKRDTLYLDLDWEVGFQYLFVGGNYFKTFVHNKFTNVLNVDTNQIIRTRKLPEINDVRNTLFGVEYFYENLDYRINPTKGVSLIVSAAAGTRRIRELSEVAGLSDPENPGFTFESLYDSLNLRSVQYKFDYRIDKFWKLGKRSTVKTGLRGGALISNNIFFNEQFRIGGSRLLRGFDEEEIFTSLFDVVTVEYRFLLSENSHFHVFFDGAYVESRVAGGFESDFPFGFGAGLAFETKAGLFGVTYALGKQQNNPIDFKSAKLHFGYVNYF